MRRLISNSVLACALGLSIAQPVQAAETPGEAWDQVKAYSVEKKKEAVVFGRKLVRDADSSIKTLEAEVSKTKGDVKSAHQDNLKELKLKRAQAAAKLGEMGKASGAAWDATKHGFADAYQDLQHTYRRAAAQFK